MADHRGSALEGHATFELGGAGCVAARGRSRVRRHPLDPCGHPAPEEHARAAQRSRLRGKCQRSEARHRVKCDRRREPEGEEGARVAGVTLGVPPLDHRRGGGQKISTAATKNESPDPILADVKVRVRGDVKIVSLRARDKKFCQTGALQ